MNAPLYTIEVLRLAASLPDPERLEAVHGTAEERSPTCGSVVRTEVQMDEQGRVAAVSQRVHACAFGQAAAALVARHAAGFDSEALERVLPELSSWLDGGNDRPPDWPQIEMLAPVRGRKSRHAAVLLPFRALLAAMRQAVR